MANTMLSGATNFTFWQYNWPAFVWSVVILVLCLMPGRDLPHVTFWQADKLAHVMVYALLSILCFFGWKKQTQCSALHFYTGWKIWLLCTAYGFMVEILQHYFTADRNFDLLDVLANSTGAWIGLVVAIMGRALACFA